MLTIILPGYSPHNKEWAYDVKKNLKLDHEVVVHEWWHWRDFGANLKLRKEIGNLIKTVGDQKVNFIAKSVGTRVVMHLAPLLEEGQLQKIILCGIPTRGKSELTRKVYKKGFDVLNAKRTICFQNTKDPFASFSDIKEFVGSINPKIKIIEKPGNDHNYPYFEDFQKFLS